MPKITDTTRKIIRREITLNANDIKELISSRKAQNLLGELPDKYTLRVQYVDDRGYWFDHLNDSEDTIKIIIESEEIEEENIK